ncbi:hypothetical protein EON67_02160 [archaeon]|nr:MAG: hypothetical protein EON67_02160 [archaeon]
MRVTARACVCVNIACTAAVAAVALALAIFARPRAHARAHVRANVQKFLLGYEFPDTIMLLTRDVFYVHASSKKRTSRCCPPLSTCLPPVYNHTHAMGRTNVDHHVFARVRACVCMCSGLPAPCCRLGERRLARRAAGAHST